MKLAQARLERSAKEQISIMYNSNDKVYTFAMFHFVFVGVTVML